MISRRNFTIGGATLAAALSWQRAALANDAMRFGDLYVSNSAFSERAQALDGSRIEMDGYMAPPLKAESAFFVLTKMPMAVCPFCETEADWPQDIVSVYSRDIVAVAPFNVPIRVSGTLRLGVYTDAELGFVSKVRLVDADYRRL
jgi:hypothetical protein